MGRDSEWLDWAALILLAAVWVGIWGPWIPNPAVALTQNALDLAEWATFLTDVRYGGLRLMPELLRLGVALAGVALAVAAGAIERWPLRWVIRLAAVIPGMVMLPPYPFLLNPIGSGYEWRMAAALVLWAGVGLTLFSDQLGWKGQRWLIVAVSGLAVVSGWWAYLAIQGPFGAHYSHALHPGWGLIVFGLGLVAAAGLAVYEMLGSAADLSR
jgi:hypothetical protein